MLEFPEVTGRTRRDYWLAILREVIQVQQFIFTFQLKGVGKVEALAKAVLGIAQLKATKETCHVLPPKPENLLTCSLGAEMPGGDLILVELANALRGISRGEGQVNEESTRDKPQGNMIFVISAAALVASFHPSTPKETEKIKETSICVGGIMIGETTPLEKAILQS